ncbi:MAG: helix-turn-helix domain-containing protein [Thermoanaerobaculia bacterium]|nr:helix-turn-helix domain-containing protein [Thermoanaerobaculia bacterium]
MDAVEFLTAAEAARKLRTTTRTVYALIDSGALRAVRLGRSLRIPVEALGALPPARFSAKSDLLEKAGTGSEHAAGSPLC